MKQITIVIASFNNKSLYIFTMPVRLALVCGFPFCLFCLRAHVTISAKLLIICLTLTRYLIFNYKTLSAFAP